jgi:hypothetical protein
VKILFKEDVTVIHLLGVLDSFIKENDRYFPLRNLFSIVFAESLLRTTNLKSKSSYQLNQFPLATNKYGSR